MQGEKSKKFKHLSRGLVLTAIVVGLSIIAFVYVWEQWPTKDQWLVIFAPEHRLSIGIYFACVLIGTFLRSHRWRVLMEKVFQLSFVQAFIVYSWSFFLVVFLPYRLGEGARPLWVRGQGGSAFAALGVQVIERINDLIMVLILAFLVMAVLPEMADWLQLAGKVMLVCGAIGYLGLYFFINPVRNWLNNLTERHRSGLLTRMVLIMEGLASVRSPRVFFSQLLLTASIWSVLSLGYYCFIQSFFPGAHWATGLAVMVAVTLSSIVPATPGNFGLYEAACVFVLTTLGMSQPEAIVTAFALHAVEILSALIIGLVAKVGLLISSSKKPAPLRQDEG